MQTTPGRLAAESATCGAPGTLRCVTPVQKAVLALEADVAACRISRSDALTTAHTEWGLSETRYFQQLLAVLDDADALVEHPMLVHRLERLRDRRRGGWR